MCVCSGPLQSAFMFLFTQLDKTNVLTFFCCEFAMNFSQKDTQRVKMSACVCVCECWQ